MDDIQELLIDQIDEPRDAMRSEINRDEVFELATDIKKNGLINPITVRPVGDRFEVVAGHRRLLAHRYGGILRIRCIVRELDDDAAYSIMTSENLKREDVNPVDEAGHVARLLKIHYGNVSKVAEICGRSPTWVESRVEIGQMTQRLQQALRFDKIKLGVAIALNGITDETDQEAVLQMAMTQGASVVSAQYWLAQWRAGLFGHATSVSLPDPNDPNMVRQVVMLRCTVDGKDYPAEDMRSVLVYKNNIGFIDALREHLSNSPVSIPVEHAAPSEASVS